MQAGPCTARSTEGFSGRTLVISRHPMSQVRLTPTPFDGLQASVASQTPLMVDSRSVSTAGLHEEEMESRYEATFVVGLVIGLQVTLAVVSLGGGWKLIGLPGWVWLIPAVPEAALLIALAWSVPRHRLEQMGKRRTVALALVGVIAAANLLALIALIASLLNAQEKSGGELLLKGATIWSTNVVTFGLLFWELDRGGPMRRAARAVNILR